MLDISRQKYNKVSSVSNSYQGPKKLGNITTAVNVMSLQSNTLTEAKKKRFDVKLDAKKHLAKAKQFMNLICGVQYSTI